VHRVHRVRLVHVVHFAHAVPASRHERPAPLRPRPQVVNGRRALELLGIVAALVVPPALWQLSVRAAVARELVQLGRPDADVRAAASARLAAMGPEIVPQLIGAFAEERGGGAPRPADGPDAQMPVTAPLMNLLREIENQDVIAQLLVAMRDPDQDVRHYAGLTLAYIGTDAVPALVGTLRTAPDARSRTSAAWVLSFMGAVGANAVPALRAALKDEHPDVRRTARYALQQLTDEGGVLWQAVDRARVESPR
jgi:HEAT repeat protein